MDEATVENNLNVHSRDCKIRSGYRVYGYTSLGERHMWYQGSLEGAIEFAEHLAKSGQEVDVLKYVCSVRPAAVPTEVIKATDWKEKGK